MSRRSRIPAPFQRLLPSVIRGAGPRLALAVAGCAALLLLGGSTLIAHLTATPQTPAQKPAISARTHTNAQILGAATDNQADSATTNTSASAGTGNSTTTAASPPQNTPPDCTTDCSSSAIQQVTTLVPPLPSFDIAVNTANIQRDLLGVVHVPFSVTRHNGLSTPIVPASVTISSGGKLTNLITIQAETMLDANNGTLTLVPVGLFPRDISVQFNAHSGSATASTNFSYHIPLL